MTASPSVPTRSGKASTFFDDRRIRPDRVEDGTEVVPVRTACFPSGLDVSSSDEDRMSVDDPSPERGALPARDRRDEIAPRLHRRGLEGEVHTR